MPSEFDRILKNNLKKVTIFFGYPIMVCVIIIPWLWWVYCMRFAYHFAYRFKQTERHLNLMVCDMNRITAVNIFYAFDTLIPFVYIEVLFFFHHWLLLLIYLCDVAKSENRFYRLDHGPSKEVWSWRICWVMLMFGTDLYLMDGIRQQRLVLGLHFPDSDICLLLCLLEHLYSLKTG